MGAPAPADRGGGGEPCAQGRGPGAGFGGSHLRAFSVSASGQGSCGRAGDRARSGAAAPKRAAAGDAPALRHTLLRERGGPPARCLGARERPLRPSEIETPSKSRCCCCRGSRRAVTRSSDAAGAGGGQELFEVAAGACGGVAGCMCRSARRRGDLSSTKAAPGVCAAPRESAATCRVPGRRRAGPQPLGDCLALHSEHVMRNNVGAGAASRSQLPRTAIACALPD